MRHTIGVLVENHFGVLTRIAGLFFSRGYNISSLAVGETEDPSISRMTIVVKGDDRVLEQIVKQLDRLVEVIKVEDYVNDETTIERELALVKVEVTPDTRAEVMQIVTTFRARVIDVNPKSVIVEMTGSAGKIDAMIELMEQFGVIEVVNTGVVAMSREKELSARRYSGKAAPKKAKAKKAAPKKKATKKKATKKATKKKKKK